MTEFAKKPEASTPFHVDVPIAKVVLDTAAEVSGEVNHTIQENENGSLDFLSEFERQYTFQKNVAEKSGLFPEGKLEIKRGTETYPFPTQTEVANALRENAEIIKMKHAQGFTKMLVVPFGLDLKSMAQQFKTKVKELDATPTGILDAKGQKIEFKKGDADYSVSIWDGWDDSKIAYFPERYNQTTHGGKTKEEVIKANGAWQILFVEDMAVVPSEGEDKTIGGRKQIDRKGSSLTGIVKDKIPSIRQYHEASREKSKMTDGKQYEHEKGMTAESILWM